jgi:hypothetical protein
VAFQVCPLLGRLSAGLRLRPALGLTAALADAAERALRGLTLEKDVPLPPGPPAKRDWPALEEAVDAKIEEQIRFVAWWKGAVRGKGEKANSRDRGYFVSEAEQLTGMSHQRVADRIRSRQHDRGRP